MTNPEFEPEYDQKNSIKFKKKLSGRSEIQYSISIMIATVFQCVHIWSRTQKGEEGNVTWEVVINSEMDLGNSLLHSVLKMYIIGVLIICN
jgi:hypothetical protein